MGGRSDIATALTGMLGMKPVKTGFEDKGAAETGDMVGVVFGTLTAAVISILTILLLGFLVKFLWNNSMPYMFATARPVSSLWTMYAFMLMVYFVL